MDQPQPIVSVAKMGFSSMLLLPAAMIPALVENLIIRRLKHAIYAPLIALSALAYPFVPCAHLEVFSLMVIVFKNALRCIMLSMGSAISVLLRDVLVLFHMLTTQTVSVKNVGLIAISVKMRLPA